MRTWLTLFALCVALGGCVRSSDGTIAPSKATSAAIGKAADVAISLTDCALGSGTAAKAIGGVLTADNWRRQLDVRDLSRDVLCSLQAFAGLLRQPVGEIGAAQARTLPEIASDCTEGTPCAVQGRAALYLLDLAAAGKVALSPADRRQLCQDWALQVEMRPLSDAEIARVDRARRVLAGQQGRCG